MSYIWAILVFLIFIFIHELGHLIAAKKSGMKVDEFSVGMGPKIYQIKKGETFYSLRIIPFGGYCAIAGEDEDSEDDRAFNNAPLKSQFITILAGAFSNFAFGLIICIGLMSFSSTTPEIYDIVENSPAEEMDLEKGDYILQINGEAVKTVEDVQLAIQNSKGEPIVFLLENTKGETREISGTATKSKDGNYSIGVQFQSGYELQSFSLIRGIKEGTKLFFSLLFSLFSVLKMLFTGQVGVGGLSGPVGVVRIISDAAKSGIVNVLFLLAYININLGVMNLLPFPALDGGRAFFILIEMITGKKVPVRIEGIIHTIGIILLLGLIVFVTFNDIQNLIFR